MDVVRGNLFSLFCSTWRAVLKMFVRLFRIEASESLDKSLAGAIYKGQNWESETKRALDYLRRPKLVIATRESLFCKIFFTIILLWARKDVEKLFEETVYKYDKEKRRKSETNNSVWNLKSVLTSTILEKSSGTRQVCVSVYFLFWS